MPQTLAQRVRAKFPGAYDDLTDQQLEAAVTAKYPGAYDDIPRTTAAQAQAPAATRSATSRFLSNLGETLNPVTAVEGIASAVRHPIDTLTNIAGQQIEQGRQALDLARQGRYVEAAGHGAAAALPLIGPAAAHAGEQIASGDVAGGLGTATGLLAPVAAPAAVRGAAKVARALPESAAAAAESGAASRVAKAMTPQVGPNKLRFGGMAEKVAPEVAKDLATEGAPLTREGLQAQIGAKLEEAQQALDAAADNRLVSQQVPTKPIVTKLNQQIADLTAQPLDASKATRRAEVGIVPGEGSGQVITRAEPHGQAVQPGPNAEQIKTLQQIRDEVAQLGPVADYEAIRRIRQAWDNVAKVKYMPSSAQDALKSQGAATAAMKGTGAIRDALAAADPATAAANAKYSVYKTAKDVLDATAEVERTRPRVGRAIMTRLTTTLAGEHAAGVPGAIAGYALAPLADAAASMGFTTQLKTAALLQKLAGAIRSGEVDSVGTLATRLKQLQASSLMGRTPSVPLTPQIASAEAR